jgi:hypothetical protein
MQRAYYEAGRVYDALHVVVGVLALIANGIIIINKSAFGDDAVILAVAAVLSIIFVAIQTSFKFAQTANKLRITGAKFANLRDRLEDLLTCQVSRVLVSSKNDADKFQKELKSIMTKWDKVRMGSPNVPWLFWWWAELGLTSARFEKDHENVKFFKKPK